MRVQVYAVLKDHFEKEFELNGSVHSVAELSDVLIQLNPAVKNIIPICRFAVNDNFVDNNFQLQSNDSIHIIPPSSGG
jgi:molybdopterin synthase sulfur carrier subunit